MSDFAIIKTKQSRLNSCNHILTSEQEAELNGLEQHCLELAASKADKSILDKAIEHLNHKTRSYMNAESRKMDWSLFKHKNDYFNSKLKD